MIPSVGNFVSRLKTKRLATSAARKGKVRHAHLGVKNLIRVPVLPSDRLEGIETEVRGDVPSFY